MGALQAPIGNPDAWLQVQPSAGHDVRTLCATDGDSSAQLARDDLGEDRVLGHVAVGASLADDPLKLRDILTRAEQDLDAREDGVALDEAAELLAIHS